MIESGFTHLYSRDVEAALRFYRDLLGFEETFRTPAEDPEHVELRAPGIAIGIGAEAAARTHHHVTPAPGAPAMCLTLWVADVEEAFARLEAAEVPVHWPPRDHGSNRSAGLRDPDGVLVELVSRRR